MTRSTLDPMDVARGRAGGARCRRGSVPFPGPGVGLAGTVLLGVLAAGCGGNPARQGARLAGSVTLDAQPIAEGNLQFVPQDPGQGSPVAAAIKDGRYVAPAVPPGKVRVLISATRKTGKMITVYSQPYEEVVNIIPDKYHDGIEITVTGDDPNLNFELRSR